MEEKKKYITVLMLRGTGQLGFVSEMDYQQVHDRLEEAGHNATEFTEEDPKVGIELNICVNPREVIAFYVSEFHKLSVMTPGPPSLVQ